GPEAEARLAQLAQALETTPDALLDSTRARSASAESEGPGAGWVVTDVAPENVLDAGGEPPDPQLQQLLGELARGSQPIDDAPQPPRPMSEAVRAIATPTLIGLAALVPLALVFGCGVKLWRSVAPLFAREADRPRVLYRAALDRLSEDGLRRRWGESPESFAARCAAALPALRPLTDAHLRAAFGGRVDE